MRKITALLIGILLISTVSSLVSDSGFTFEQQSDIMEIKDYDGFSRSDELQCRFNKSDLIFKDSLLQKIDSECNSVMKNKKIRCIRFTTDCEEITIMAKEFLGGKWTEDELTNERTFEERASGSILTCGGKVHRQPWEVTENGTTFTWCKI